MRLKTDETLSSVVR